MASLWTGPAQRAGIPAARLARSYACACIAAFLLFACGAPPGFSRYGEVDGGASPELADDDAPPESTDDGGLEGDTFDWLDDGGADAGATSESTGDAGLEEDASPEWTGDAGLEEDASLEWTDDAGLEDDAFPGWTDDGGTEDGAPPESTDGGAAPPPTNDGGAESAACTLPWATSPEEVGMSADQLQEAVDTARGWVESETIVGGVLLVLRHGKIVVHEAFGWADRERGIAMQTDTIFDIASDTKPLTGVAALMLYEEQRLGFDDLASQYLPAWDNDGSRDISLYQLFTHTSGLPHSLNSYQSLAQMVEQIGADGPDLPPGTDYQYSDRGSNSLGRLVEVISGMPAERFLAERITTPLSLHDTFGVLEAGDPRRPRVASKYEGGAGNWGKSWDNTEPATTIFAPAYGMHSTVLDYGCFLETMLRGGERDGVRLLEADTVRLATRPHSDYVYPPSEREGRYSYYGLHWFVTIRGYDPDNWDDKAHMFGHGGGWGTTAWADRLHDLVFVYFTQSRDTDTLIELRDLVHDAQTD